MEAKRDMMKKVPVREQDPKVRATNFKEQLYNERRKQRGY